MSECRIGVDELKKQRAAPGRRAPGSTGLSPSGRRRFLGQVGAATAATLGASLTGWPSSSGKEAPQSDPVAGAGRAGEAYRVRLEAAHYERRLPLPTHPTNGDEELYPGRIASFTKALPHDSLGGVDAAAYDALLRAVESGDPADFEAIPLGGPRKLVNPQACITFEIEGPDSHHLTMPPPPAFASAETASEMGELYWMALTRDVPFSEYDSHPLTNAAADDLTRFSDFRGPRQRGRVDTAALYRADIPGVLEGPFISQFLLKDVPFGAHSISAQMRTASPGVDYLTAYAVWLAIQNGAAPGPQLLDPTRRYIRSGRDLARWVQVDVLFQAYFHATLILLGLRAPFDENNPYNVSRTQVGVGVLGNSHISSLVPAVATRAFKAIWFQKWRVHRRLRPEMFGGRVHNHLTGAASYPIHQEILDSPALPEISRRHGTYLLPQAFVEGSPTHPSYAAGHAGIAGACSTVLKAFFDESFVIPEPVVPAPDGLSLAPYDGPPLTVGGELNKLAWNIATGRDFAGIHYRSDQIESMRLGEEVAIRFLTEEKMTLNEKFVGFSLTRFDGTRILV